MAKAFDMSIKHTNLVRSFNAVAFNDPIPSTTPAGLVLSPDVVQGIYKRARAAIRRALSVSDLKWEGTENRTLDDLSWLSIFSAILINCGRKCRIAVSLWLPDNVRVSQPLSRILVFFII